MALIGVTIVALTLAIVAAMTYTLILDGDRRELDRVLLQELEEVRLGLPGELQAAAGEDQIVSPAEVDLAVQRYLAMHPGSDRHVTVIQIGSHQLRTRTGPVPLEKLPLQDSVPGGPPGALETRVSPAGPLRVVSAPITTGPERLGTVTVAGPLSVGRAQATEALVRIAIAGSLGLVVGGLVLLFAVRRALQPVRALAAAARSIDLADLEARVRQPSRLDEVGVMAEEFNRMLTRIADDEQQRQHMLSAVSHELRTPLAVARGHLELFETLGPAEGGSATDTAAVVRGELDRLSRIVEDLTAISHGNLDSGTSLEPVFVPDVLTALHRRLDGLGLTDVDVGESPVVVMLGDEDRLTQALLNLVVNARTHTPPTTSVRVFAHTSRHHVVFVVADDGPGVDPAVLSRVFEPFVTTRPAGAARTSGLGLTVVKAATTAQGGQVDLDTGHEGTTVSLTFPIISSTS